jgi:hypothetical protein
MDKTILRKKCKNTLEIIWLISLLTLFAFSFSSCSKHDYVTSQNEIVMVPGMTITAKNANGTITIESNQELKRVYMFDSKEIDVKLTKRDKRWNGSLGAYSPGGGAKVLTVVEEGQQHFFSQKEAIEWLAWQEKDMRYVYSSTGLVIGWHIRNDAKSPSVALSVQVWQFYIQGQKPSKLPGARDDLITVTYRVYGQNENVKAGDFMPSAPETINNRLYSGKAIDIMHEKNIQPENVENCIARGKSEKQGAYTYYYDLTNYKPLWVMLNNDGKVVLVGN